jgi:hypothetical protein
VTDLTAVSGRLKMQKTKSETASDKRNGAVDCSLSRLLTLPLVVNTRIVRPLPAMPRIEQTMAALRPVF